MEFNKITIADCEMLQEDFLKFGETCVKIRDHNTSAVVPLRPNAAQKIIHNVAEKQRAEQGNVRILLLKSRRIGGSTYIESRFYHHTSLNFNKNTFIIGHEEESTSTLFRMAKLIHENNPIAPKTLASNARELRFDDDAGTGLKSEYRLATARTVGAGRSQGIHYLHDSEEAFWPNTEETLLGLLQCVPDLPTETEIFRESTANGYGNMFQRDVMEAYHEGMYPYYVENGLPFAWTHPDTQWVLVFIPWFVHENYTLEFQTRAKKKKFQEQKKLKVYDKPNMKWVTSPEIELQEKYNLTDEQLYWRKAAIKNKCGGSIEKFQQEYPATVEEAFLATGSNTYGQLLCNSIEKQCATPLIVGNVVAQLGKTKIREDKYGAFSLWEQPVEGAQYFITADIAGGIEAFDNNKKKPRPDYTVIDVWNRASGVQCAQWHGHMDYDLVHDLIMLIGHLYNRATACVERNNHGHTVVAFLSRARWPQYEETPGKPGFLTTKFTKPNMIDGLYEAVRDSKLLIRAKETVSEMRTFIEISGKYGAAQGCNDDRVISAAMASQMMIMLPNRTLKTNRYDYMKTELGNWAAKAEV